MNPSTVILSGCGVMAALGIWSFIGPMTKGKTWAIGILGGLDVVVTIALVFFGGHK